MCIAPVPHDDLARLYARAAFFVLPVAYLMLGWLLIPAPR